MFMFEKILAGRNTEHIERRMCYWTDCRACICCPAEIIHPLGEDLVEIRMEWAMVVQESQVKEYTLDR
jgi:hypothetical protein